MAVKYRLADPGDLDVLLDAARKGFGALFREHDEEFYYCTLILSEGATPFISAFSEEALEASAKAGGERYSADELRWSYADSPYCGYGYEEYFTELDKVFSERMENTPDEDYDAAIDYWLGIMEKTMKQLAKEKVFGSRRKMFLGAEIMPPDDDKNIERAKRLNSKTVFEKWYRDNFGEEEDTVPDDFYEKLCTIPTSALVSELIPNMTSAERKAYSTFFEKLNNGEEFNGYKIKKCKPEDIDLIVKTRIIVLRAANKLDESADMSLIEKHTRRYYEKALKNRKQDSYLVFDGKKVIGAGDVCYYDVLPTCDDPTGRKAYIMNMYTDPDYRRQGIAMRVLKLLVLNALRRDITHICLEATDMGRPLYEKLGFVAMEHEMILPEEKQVWSNVQIIGQ